MIAEGIEDDSQLRRIAALGCDEAQGYYLGRPQTLAVFQRYLFGARMRTAFAGRPWLDASAPGDPTNVLFDFSACRGRSDVSAPRGHATR